MKSYLLAFGKASVTSTAIHYITYIVDSSGKSLAKTEDTREIMLFPRKFKRKIVKSSNFCRLAAKLVAFPTFNWFFYDWGLVLVLSL